MKKRTPGFLSTEKIDHKSEQFEYITELHQYLWEFVRCEIPGASGNLFDFVDFALQSAKQKSNTFLNEIPDSITKISNCENLLPGRWVKIDPEK